MSVPAAPVVGSPLDQARAAFAWLTHRPGPLTIDGRAVRGMPPRPVPVDEVRDRLQHPSCTPELRNAIWAHLIRRARSHGGAATVVCVGVALPALTEISRKLTHSLQSRTRSPRTGQAGRPGTRRRRAEQVADVESGVLSGFLTELAITDLRSHGVEVRLRSAAHEAGRQVCVEQVTAPPLRRAPFRSRPPLAPARHPDLVLARAVAAGAITRGEAILIGSTRLEPISLETIARTRGQALRDVRAARVRAERKLAAFLRGVDPEPTDLPYSALATPPRTDERRTDEHSDDKHSDDKHGDDKHGDDKHGDDKHGDDEQRDAAGDAADHRGPERPAQTSPRRGETDHDAAGPGASSMAPTRSTDARRRRVRPRRVRHRHTAPTRDRANDVTPPLAPRRDTAPPEAPTRSTATRSAATRPGDSSHPHRPDAQESS